MSNKDQDDQRPILHILSNAFHQGKCSVLIDFVCLSMCHILTFRSLDIGTWQKDQAYIFGEVTLMLMSGGVTLSSEGQDQGHGKRARM